MLGRFGELVADNFKAWQERLAAVDFINFDEIKRLVPEVLADLILAAEDAGGKGADKRAAVLEALGRFYDEVIAPKDIPHLPDWLVDPLLRRALLAFAGELIDGLVAVVKKIKAATPAA